VAVVERRGTLWSGRPRGCSGKSGTGTIFPIFNQSRKIIMPENKSEIWWLFGISLGILSLSTIVHPGALMFARGIEYQGSNSR
jgi:hypothetical protein